MSTPTPSDPIRSAASDLADAMLTASEALGPDPKPYQTLQRRAIAAAARNPANIDRNGDLTVSGMRYVARYLTLTVEDPCPN